QRNDSNQKERRRFPQCAQAEPQILDKRVEKISAELFAAFFAKSRGASELDPCATLCLGAVQSSALETVRVQPNVRTKLLLQLIVDPGAAKKSYAKRPHISNEIHFYGSFLSLVLCHSALP